MVEQLKEAAYKLQHMSASKPAPLAPWETAIAGAGGAVIANAIFYPLDM